MNRTLQILKYEKGKESFRMREREGLDGNAREKAQLQEEIERRILNMEQENHRFPQRFDKKDYVAALGTEKVYGFWDAFLVLSGYCIATWSYTQGAYLVTLVGFRQVLVSALFGAVLMLVIYQLPVILSVRYGIDIWVWLRAVFGPGGVRLMTVVIILINFPWYAVCSELFASSMTNLASLLGLALPEALHVPLALVCVLLGVLIANRGIGAITWTTRILVPLLLAVGAIVVLVGFGSVPPQTILNYRPAPTAGRDEVTVLQILRCAVGTGRTGTPEASVFRTGEERARRTSGVHTRLV